MFAREYLYACAKRRFHIKGRMHLNFDGQRQWTINAPCDAEGVGLPGRCVYAQNAAYLELCNPGWDMQWRAGFGNFLVVFPALFVIWMWYGFAISPLVSGDIIIIWPRMPYTHEANVLIWFGWLLLFPLAIGSAFLIYMWFHFMTARTAFFTYARGRIRFNRLTRKVYVLRPEYCGGNAVFEWDRLVALFKPEADGPMNKQAIEAIALYHPPFDQDDPEAKGEDAIFVGPTLVFRNLQAAGFWEYIRRYMEEGPTVDHIPPNAPASYKQIPRYLPQEYTTFCGKPSSQQYGLEQQPGSMETACHMMSQATCTWPRFPKEWQSDSGLGEPEDRPVQTGAVMTAMVYRSQGKLSPEDNIEFLRNWGTKEALAEALAKAA
ncbi:hypothetical protein CJO78_19800 (plasmid) [Ralstonia solanacearum]|nr:hypothetical protein LBM2029_19235 [Ralstonia solanacearum]AXV88569.1 hypothetical protein CJO78_19800 [Ralstonia solanacearum]AXW08043.1 hypothetical protein CJO82_19460 [Ralstonia solanacearum]AXW25834.1 hypothetical protein CJO86_19715 [Ralstonia solanacearum]AXW82744.1 hypothetical protein CJO98_19820 [Ralstonia solanacearum]